MTPIKQTPINVNCKACGKPFVAERKRRGGRYRGFCSDRCRNVAAARRAERYAREGRYERAWLCAVCEQEFRAAGATQTCSAECARILQGRKISWAARTKKAAGDLFGGPYTEDDGDC